ncbi:unnamed protein product, partial [Amoebophrya sp. A120]|eukprot:GSA120T00016216001.1
MEPFDGHGELPQEQEAYPDGVPPPAAGDTVAEGPADIEMEQADDQEMNMNLLNHDGSPGAASGAFAFASVKNSQNQEQASHHSGASELVALFNISA